jgi:uncharacterized protein (TIGR02145 family)
MKRIIFSILIIGLACIGNYAQNVKEIKIGRYTWMSENLNAAIKGSWYYNDDATMGAKYGRLYTWEAAKKACPVGWHLPTENEWNDLIEIAGGNDNAGKALKSGGNLGFNAQLSGFSNVGGYMMLDSYGTYWTASGYDQNHAWYIFFNSSDNQATKSYFTKTYGLSVRCVKN